MLTRKGPGSKTSSITVQGAYMAVGKMSAGPRVENTFITKMLLLESCPLASASLQ
jgi:hypothetical protein